MLQGLMIVAKAGMAPLAVHDIDINALLKKIAANVQFNLNEIGAQLSVEELPSCRADARPDDAGVFKSYWQCY